MLLKVSKMNSTAKIVSKVNILLSLSIFKSRLASIFIFYTILKKGAPTKKNHCYISLLKKIPIEWILCISPKTMVSATLIIGRSLFRY